jgi:thiol-disulfide isomerase/thioredoxin
MRSLATRISMYALLFLLAAQSARAGGDWNDANIAWRTYEEGLAASKKENKPVCLVFYTEWCPHCARYSQIFHDPKVVERSKSFVMIRLDADKNREISGKFAPDGSYIPRTYFLSPKGTLDLSIQAQAGQYKYFYSESDPASLLSGMARAMEKLKAPHSK